MNSTPGRHSSIPELRSHHVVERPSFEQPFEVNTAPPSGAGRKVSGEAWLFLTWTRKVRSGAGVGEAGDPAVRSSGVLVIPGALTARLPEPAEAAP